MDCTFVAGEGRFNYRVGIIITRGKQVLMARNPKEKLLCWYSVGGRVQYGGLQCRRRDTPLCHARVEGYRHGRKVEIGLSIVAK